MQNLVIRPMNKIETMYSYSQGVQIQNMTELIGHLRADMGRDGDEFFTSFFDYCERLRTMEFKNDLNEVIDYLREDFLKNRSSLSKFCYSKMTFPINDREFGVRVDSVKYTYMFRLNPNHGEYNLYCYCYVKEWLDNHLAKSCNGIRFIDSAYKPLFKLADGEKIVISYPDSEPEEKTCRYIDDYHVQIGFNVYHICEFAERMERAKASVVPA